jgi:thymidylate kinase
MHGPPQGDRGAECDPKHVWIEFVGLPGAGKSSIARVLAKRLEDSGYECLESPGFARVARGRLIQRTGRIIPSVIDVLCAVRFTYQSARMWRHILPHLRQRHIVPRYWRLMRIWAALVRIARQDDSGDGERMLILDQGILQCLRSVYPRRVGKDVEHRLTRYAIEAIQAVLPDLVVLVCVDEPTAAARMKARPFQPTSYDLESLHLESALAPHRRYAEEVLPAALEGTSTSLLRLSGHVEPEENVARIMTRLSELSGCNRVGGNGPGS